MKKNPVVRFQECHTPNTGLWFISLVRAGNKNLCRLMLGNSCKYHTKCLTAKEMAAVEFMKEYAKANPELMDTILVEKNGNELPFERLVFTSRIAAEEFSITLQKKLQEVT